VVIDGVDFATLDDAERTRLRKQRIGFVFQKFNLLPTLSAMGNIEIAWAVSGRKEKLDLKYLDHLSDLLSIQGAAAPQAVGAERRRAAARGHCAGADYAAGDCAGRRAHRQPGYEEFRRGAGDAAASNRELGQTTLMITHNPEAAAIASRILYMRDGKIVREEKGSRSEALPEQPGNGDCPHAVSADGSRFDLVLAARYTQTCDCGSSSVVEHRLAKARVASSNLVSRSIPPSGARRVGYGGLER
jgi:predicted ABC-type transport system involved in lysophospholipase L1 biosynthesis ATPase subunit